MTIDKNSSLGFQKRHFLQWVLKVVTLVKWKCSKADVNVDACNIFLAHCVTADRERQLFLVNHACEMGIV